MERNDPKSGKTYYYNPVTREKTWEKPSAIAVSSTSDAPKDREEDMWVAREDTASGKTYYFHRVTKETRWNKPGQDEPRAPDAEETPAHLPTKPVALNDGTSILRLGSVNNRDKFAKLRALAKIKGLDVEEMEAEQATTGTAAEEDQKVGFAGFFCGSFWLSRGCLFAFFSLFFLVQDTLHLFFSLL